MNTQLESSFIHAFNALSIEQHSRMKAQGFWETSDALQSLADAHGMGDAMRKMRNSQLRDLIVSELGEACEGEREDLMSDKIPGFTNAEEEYADVIIRMMDMNAARKLRIAEAVIEKMGYNLTRSRKHGGKHF